MGVPPLRRARARRLAFELVFHVWSVLLLRRRRRWRLKGREGRGKGTRDAAAMIRRTRFVTAELGRSSAPGFHLPLPPSLSLHHLYGGVPRFPVLTAVALASLHAHPRRRRPPRAAPHARFLPHSSSSSALRPVALVEALRTPLVCAPTASELDAYSSFPTNPASTELLRGTGDWGCRRFVGGGFTTVTPLARPAPAPAPPCSPSSSTKATALLTSRAPGRAVAVCVREGGFVVVSTARAFVVDGVSGSGGGGLGSGGGARCRWRALEARRVAEDELEGEWEWEWEASGSSGSGRPPIRALHTNRSVHARLHTAKNGSRVAFLELLDLDSGLYTTGGVLNLDLPAGMGTNGAYTCAALPLPFPHVARAWTSLPPPSPPAVIALPLPTIHHPPSALALPPWKSSARRIRTAPMRLVGVLPPKLCGDVVLSTARTPPGLPSRQPFARVDGLRKSHAHA
ncbi:hypothetical protein C8F04DRAFT_1260059 [Mycena alexandri]|uniref:Uncharacterized protein n=1 Tax=Mycena alexandri TaxID=1745969 RepID=A0AAD6SUH0_9AGAR|nr:hypothetical protein C8F04DRAFT_1260059 [Mycena alexandri]